MIEKIAEATINLDIVEGGEGGSSIIYQSTEPSPTDHQSGDTWYKTDANDNVVGVYAHDGTSWEKKEYTSTALNMNDVQNNIDYIGAGTGDTITLVLDGVAMRVSENIGGGEVLNIRAPITRISPKVEGESGSSSASALYVSNGGVNIFVPDHTGATSNLGEISVTTNTEGSEINLNANKVLVNGQPIGGGTTPNDYVVEEDALGIYRWRKWESGRSEVWGYWRGSNTHYSTFSGWYSRYFDWSFPSGVFINPMSGDDNLPNAQFTARVGSGFSMTAGISYNTTPNTLRTYVLSSTSGAQTCSVWIYATGRWK